MAVRKTLRKKRYNKKGGAAPQQQMSKEQVLAELKSKRASETDPAKQAQLNFAISAANMAQSLSSPGNSKSATNSGPATDIFSSFFASIFGSLGAAPAAPAARGGRKY